MSDYATEDERDAVVVIKTHWRCLGLSTIGALGLLLWILVFRAGLRAPGLDLSDPLVVGEMAIILIWMLGLAWLIFGQVWWYEFGHDIRLRYLYRLKTIQWQQVTAVHPTADSWFAGLRHRHPDTFDPPDANPDVRLTHLVVETGARRYRIDVDDMQQRAILAIWERHRDADQVSKPTD